MKEHDVKLTIKETEQLCHLYMDCRLTVLEEAELEYVLGKIPYSSPIIDDVRMLTGIPLRLQKAPDNRRLRRRRRIVRLTTGVAASVAILCGIFISAMWQNEIHDDSVIAYENGQKLDRQSAEDAVEASIEKAEALMANAHAIEQADLKKQTFLMNLSDPTK